MKEDYCECLIIDWRNGIRIGREVGINKEGFGCLYDRTLVEKLKQKRIAEELKRGGLNHPAPHFIIYFTGWIGQFDVKLPNIVLIKLTSFKLIFV